MQNKLFKRVLTGVLSAALVAGGAVIPQAEDVQAKAKVKAIEISYVDDTLTPKTVENDSVIEVKYPSNATEVEAQAFVLGLEGNAKGVKKGAVVKIGSEKAKLADGDPFVVTQSEVGKDETINVVATAKAKGKKNKKVKVKYAVAFTKDADWTIATSLDASISKDTLAVGETAVLTVKVEPENADVVCVSSDDSIVTVDDKGVVTAVAVGTATITVASGELSKDITVTVKEGEPEPVEPEELALESIEDASGGTFNILIATFSKSIGTDLAPADVQIRRVEDNKLFSIEKVVMSSDGKKATLTLSNTDAAGVNASVLDANVTYKLIVTYGGEVAEKEFTIPATETGAVVTGTDKGKKTISIGNLKFSDPNGLVEDYTDILGRTVTFTFNSDSEIQTLNVKDETVIYTAITAKDTNNDGNIDTIVDTDKNEYNLVGPVNNGLGKADTTVTAATPNGQVYATTEICPAGDVSIYSSAAGAVAIGDPADTAKYAKIVLNGNGTVRSLVTVYTWDKSVYVASVKDSKYLVDASGAFTDLTDFSIMKNGEYATIDDIVEGDVVFVRVNGDKKIADIFSDNTVEGKLKVYAGKADIGTERFDLEGFAVIGDKVKAANTDNLKDEDGAEVVAYLDRANKLSQIVVNSTSVTTTSEFVVITEGAKLYNEGADYVVSFKGGNGTDVSEYKLKVSDLTTLVAPNGIKVEYDKDNATPNGAVPAGAMSGTFGINDDDTISLTAGDMDPGVLVKVSKNAEGTIIGLEFAEADGAKDYEFYLTNGNGAADRDMAKDTIADDTFAGKDTALKNGKMIEAGTPVYVYNIKNKTVVKYDYKDVVFTAFADALGEVNARFNGSKVAAFYIDEDATDLDEAAVKETKRAILDSFTLTADKKNFAELVVYIGTQKVTYKEFAQDVAKTKLPTGDDEKGDFIDVKLTEEGKVFDVDSVTSNAANLGEFVIEDNKIDDQYILNTETGVTTTILVKKADGTYETKTWSELGTLLPYAKNIFVATYGSSADYVDAIYVELSSDQNDTLGAVAISKMTQANTAANALDFTVAKWNEWLTAKAEADAANKAYDDAATGNDWATDLDDGGEATAYTANLAALASANVEASKTKFADADYSAASDPGATAAVDSLASLKTRIKCADDGIVDSSDTLVKVKVKAEAAITATTVTVYATFIDGTEEEASITTDSLDEKIVADSEVYPTT